MRGARHRIPAPRRCVLAEELGSGSDTPFLGMSQVPVRSPRPQAPRGLLMPCGVILIQACLSQHEPELSRALIAG